MNILFIVTLFFFVAYAGINQHSEEIEEYTKQEMLTKLVKQVRESKKRHEELKYTVYELLSHEKDIYTQQPFYSKQDLFTELGNCFKSSRDLFKIT